MFETKKNNQFDLVLNKKIISTLFHELNFLFKNHSKKESKNFFFVLFLKNSLNRTCIAVYNVMAVYN